MPRKILAQKALTFSICIGRDPKGNPISQKKIININTKSTDEDILAVAKVLDSVIESRANTIQIVEYYTIVNA